MAGADIITFGCRLNTYESEVMRRETAELDGTVVFNTCAVTAEAQRQARQSIRKAKRNNPDARIVVTGCAAQVDPDSFADMPEVDLVIGNEEKFTKANYLARDFGTGSEEKVRVNDIMSVTETASHMVDGFAERTRAFVQIQNGCDHRCTFCIIPFGRGNSRSVPAGDVVAQTRKLVEAGYAEIVFTGVDITSYGNDLPGTMTLGKLTQKVLNAVPELKRLRLSSIDSIETDQHLLDAFANEDRLMPHLHLSLQAGDNMILKRMKRRHLREDSIEFCRQIRALRPDVVFGADIIAGFPTETDEMFANSLDIVDECGLTWLHVFPFSPRPGTPAARMPQVNGAVISDRARQLREKGNSRVANFLCAQKGRQSQVLAETELSGRTEQFAPVALDRPVAPGRIIHALITGNDAGQLTAETLT